MCDESGLIDVCFVLLVVTVALVIATVILWLGGAFLGELI
jgi:hypothetical protein